MRHHLFILVSVILVSATVASLSPAVAARYCLRGRHFGYPGNCQFSTLQQCQATAAGTGSYCGVNPRYAYARQRPSRQ